MHHTFKTAISIPRSLWPSACATSLSTGFQHPSCAFMCVCVCSFMCVFEGNPIQLDHPRGGFDYGALRVRNLWAWQPIVYSGETPRETSALMILRPTGTQPEVPMARFQPWAACPLKIYRHSGKMHYNPPEKGLRWLEMVQYDMKYYMWHNDKRKKPLDDDSVLQSQTNMWIHRAFRLLFLVGFLLGTL